MDEVKRVRPIVGTVVGTSTRLSTAEYKQWSSLRGRVYLSKQRMKRHVRGSLVTVSETRDFEAFYEACHGTGYVARKGLYSKNNQGKGG